MICLCNQFHWFQMRNLQQIIIECHRSVTGNPSSNALMLPFSWILINSSQNALKLLDSLENFKTFAWWRIEELSLIEFVSIRRFGMSLTTEKHSIFISFGEMSFIDRPVNISSQWTYQTVYPDWHTTSPETHYPFDISNLQTLMKVLHNPLMKKHKS
jgi:hypothetical protein